MRLFMIPSISVSRTKTVALGLLASAVVSISFADAAAAQSVPIYENGLKSVNARSQIVTRSPGNCKRGGSEVALRVTVGKQTKACNFGVPVVGRDVELTATGRIFKSIPSQLKKSIFLGANVRQGRDGSQYQLAVFPSGRRFQIRKILPNGSLRVLKGGRNVASIRAFSEANRISLRAYNGVAGLPASSARLVAFVNGKVVGVADDARGNELKGRDSGFSIASGRNATGAAGSFSTVVVRIPNPF
jgi:hypothetical protein